MNLGGRTILVTGGTSGTGLAVAVAAHRLGAEVLIGSRSASSYATAAEQVGADRVRPFLADLGDPASIDRAIETLGAGVTDIVHAAAGGLEPLIRPLLRAAARVARTPEGPEREAAYAAQKERLTQLAHDTSARAFAVNQDGPTRLLQRLVPALPDGARVLVYASLWSDGLSHGQCPAFYWGIAESKSRFERWLDAAAHEWGARVRVAALVAHMISDTSTGQLLDRNLVPMMTPEDQVLLRSGYVTAEQVTAATLGLLTTDLEPGALRRFYLVGSERLTDHVDREAMAVIARMPF